MRRQALGTRLQISIAGVEGKWDEKSIKEEKIKGSLRLLAGYVCVH